MNLAVFSNAPSATVKLTARKVKYCYQPGDKLNA